MIEFTGHLNTARVWLDALPDCPYPIIAVREQSVETRQSAPPGREGAAVEIRLVRGPHAPYGLLGGTYQPATAGGLLLQVASSEVMMPENWRTSSTIGDVRCGLPSEHVASVLGGALHALSSSPLGPGIVRFECAAYSPVDSSDMVFGWLAGAVVRLLGMSGINVVDEDVREVLKRQGPPFLWEQ